MRSLLTKIVLAAATLWYGSLVLAAEFLGFRHGAGTIFDKAPRRWAKWLAWAAGMKVRAHGLENIAVGKPHIYVANHVSIMDIPAMLLTVPEHGFVAKRELSQIPLFGPAARAVGVVYIDRANRKSAFAAYEEAAENVRNGKSVIVFPEGTRGSSYEIRPFKKGPFVLAVRAGVPVIPVVIRGTIEVTPNGTTDVNPGVVDVQFLEPVSAEGLDYEDRDKLADIVQSRMISAMSLPVPSYSH